MKDHYQFSDEQWAALQKQGVTIKDLINAVPLFDPHGSRQPLTKINLFYYIDNKGDWRNPPKFPHKKIAEAFFKSLDLSAKEKLQVFDYIDGEE